MTDLSKIKTVERTIEILHPATKEELGVSVTLMSPNDPRLDTLRKQVSQKQLALQAKGKVEKVEDVKATRHKILFTAITRWDWRGDANFNGEKPDLTPANFNEIVEELPWFMQQLDEEFGEIERFFQAAESI